MNPSFKPVASGGDGSLTQFWYFGYDPGLEVWRVWHINYFYRYWPHSIPRRSSPHTRWTSKLTDHIWLFIWWSGRACAWIVPRNYNMKLHSAPWSAYVDLNEYKWTYKGFVSAALTHRGDFHMRSHVERIPLTMLPFQTVTVPRNEWKHKAN